MPACSLAAALWCQVPQVCDQASTCISQSPSQKACTRAVQMSRPIGSTWVMSVTTRLPRGLVSTTEAPTRSWPSRKTFAETVNSSSTTA